jgi:radical SAM family uncharacterized protein
MEYKDLFLLVEKPARYAGGEFNLPDINKPHKVKYCIAFPDVYEVGMSNLGIQIIYDILNKDKDIVCERCFAPWTDMGELRKKYDIPLCSIETKTPLKDFDILGISVQYELAYTSILYLLDLAKIPFYAKDRDGSYPLIVGGGPCVANPEPLADFFDIIVIGDGEEANLKLTKLAAEYKGDKQRILKEAAKIEGCYVPSLCAVENGLCVTPVKKACVKDLDKAPYPEKPLVPNMEVVHNRPVVELYRGCYAGCRFCQACFFYRPIRIREKGTVERLTEELIKSTGTEELGFSSLSSGDYPDICSVIDSVYGLCKQKNVKIQFPSLRLDSYHPALAESTRKSGLTFAPEAGTQRLRDVINKNITDEDIDRTTRAAFSQGYRSVKLYFMVGLPTETDDDLRGIANIVRRIKEIHYEVHGNRAVSISVSASIFVPKPLTPFQWVPQIPFEEMERRQQFLRNELRKIKGVSFHWHEPAVSWLEAVFARGDRSLSKLVEDAYLHGAVFDGWTDKFRFDVWKESIERLNIDTNKYTGGYGLDARLPWDFIDFGVTKKYLLNEYKMALEGKVTPSCKLGCRACGASKYADCKIQKNW